MRSTERRATLSEIAEKYGIDLFTQGKCQCPRCAEKGLDTSKDNLKIYGTDVNGKHKGAYCWACTFTILSEEELELRGLEEDKEIELVGSVFNEEIHAQLKKITTTNSMNFRGIRADTCSYFGVRHEYDTTTGEMVAQYYPTTRNNQLCGYKRRELPKKFTAIGETGKECEMFGQFRFKGSNQKTVLVVGGEIDQLSAFQMLDDYDKSKSESDDRYERRPVVSSTLGESGTAKQIQAQFEWFNRFDKIILCLDMDEAGQKAMHETAKVLPKGKVFVMTLPLKDANEHLKAGRTKEFVSAYFAAKPYSPSGIVGSSALPQAVREALSLEKIPLPPFMHRLQKLMAGGIPLGVIVNLGSASGTGKSTFSDELVYHWIFHSPHHIGIVSMEAEKGQYGINLMSRHIGRKINLIESVEDKLALMEEPWVVEKEQELYYLPDGTDRFHLIDDRDGGLDDLKDKIMELIIKCGCKVIILDPLQDIMDGLDDKEQAVFMRWMKGMVKSHGVTFININHIRKSSVGGRQNSRGASISEEDMQGSSTIFKSGACNLLFTRDKLADDPVEQNTTIMMMTKCRWTGITSAVAGKYYYDNATHTMHDYDDFMYHNRHLLIPQDDFEDTREYEESA